MQINTLAKGTNKIIAELQAKHGDKKISLNDIPQEDRELIGKATGGKAQFTVAEIKTGLVDAFDAIKKEDGRGWFRDGKNDGVVQQDELAKAGARNPASSPLYTRIAQRIEKAETLKVELGVARNAQWDLGHAMTGPDYVKVLADAFAPYKDMAPRKAYETALARYAATGNEDAAAKLKEAWQPLEGALRDLNTAATAYTNEEKNERMQKLRDVIRENKDAIPGWQTANKRQAAEYGPTYITHFNYQIDACNRNIRDAEKALEETLTRPSIPASERDANQLKAQTNVDKLAGDMKFIIEDYGIALLSFRPEVMDADALAKHRMTVETRVKNLETELAKVAIS